MNSGQPLFVEASRDYRVGFAQGRFISRSVSFLLLEGLMKSTFHIRTPWSHVVIRDLSIAFLFTVLTLCVSPQARRIRIEIRDDRVVIPKLLRRIEVPWVDIDKVILRTDARFPHKEYLDFVFRNGTESAFRLGESSAILLSGINIPSSFVRYDILKRNPNLTIVEGDI